MLTLTKPGILQLRHDVGSLYDKNDLGHGLDHAEEVVAQSRIFSEAAGLGPEDTLLAVAAAYLHDCLCHVDRSTHHELAFKFVMSSSSPLHCPQWDKYYVALACLEHRASWRGGFTTVISEVVSCADRGCPSFVDLVKRGTAYHESHGAANPRAEVKAHIREKYAAGGYAKYSPLYMKVYKREVKDLQRQVAAYVA